VRPSTAFLSARQPCRRARSRTRQRVPHHRPFEEIATVTESSTSTTPTPADAGSLGADVLSRFEADFAADPAHRIVQNAVTVTPVDKIAKDRQLVVSLDTAVSHRLDSWKAANQKKSGRCWLFAGLNLLRWSAAQQLGVKNFEFSQAYMHFWDKLEKANYFLTSMIDLAGRDEDDRTVHHLLSDPIGYGVVPQAAMPETDSSSCTGPMNRTLSTLLRQGARDLRVLAAGEGADGYASAAIAARKEELLTEVHRVLSIHLGTPPQSFEWQWNTEDNGFTRDGVLTPLEFAQKYISVDLDDYVCLVNDPRSEYAQTFTVDRLGNVVGGAPVVYLNAPADVLRRATMDTIVDGEPVWFGCDTGKQCDGEAGIWDAKLFDYDSVYGIDFDLDKAERLRFGDSLMTHAMLFTGVDVKDATPRKWRVENSWGDEKADKGFFTMNDSWFGEHVFEVAVHKDRLPEEYRAALETQPVVLPAWDPMGALARG
jgi:bleomycin hydrolase